MSKGIVSNLRWRGVMMPLVIGGLMILIVYSNTWHSPFVFDDIHSIVEDESRRSIDISLPAWFGTRSIPYFTFDLNYAAGGLNVVGYHAVNIAVHAVTSWTVFFLAYFLSQLARPTKVYVIKKLSFTNHLSFSLLVCLLFAVHPLQTQAVTYIVQRLASMAAMFYLMSMLFFVRFHISRMPVRKLIWAGLSLFAALLAMNSKETAITLPVVMVMLELFFFTKDTKKKKWWKLGVNWRDFAGRLPVLVPWILMLAIIPGYMLGVRDVFWPGPGIPEERLNDTVVDKISIGDVLQVAAETKLIKRPTYLFTQINVVRTYLRLLIWPTGQNLDYDYPLTFNLFNWPTILSLSLHLLLLVMAIVLFAKGRRIASFGILFFYLALLPESSIIPITDVAFEHRLYLPLFGFALLAGDLWQWILDRVGKKRRGKQVRRSVALLFAVLVVVMLSIAAWRRNAVWRDDLTLWTDTYKRSPHKARPYNNLGKAYLDRRMFDEAEKFYKEELKIDPNSVSGHNNLGSIYGVQGKYKEAIAEIKKALELRPDHDAAYNNLGNIYMLMGDNKKAVEAYKTSIGLNAKDAGVFRNMGDVLVKLGRYEEAARAYEMAISMKPNKALWHSKLGAVYGLLGKHGEAEKQLVMAINSDPKLAAAYSNLGNVYKAQGKDQEALRAYAMYLQLKPKDAGALTNVGVILARMKQVKKATEAFEAALKADPDFAPARKNLNLIKGE